MAQIFTMPQLGSTMEEGTVLNWRKQEGDAIRKGEILLEVMTDKASMEVDATVEGVLRKILVAPDATVPVLQPIAIIGAADESIEALLSQLGLNGVTEAASSGAAVTTRILQSPATPEAVIAVQRAAEAVVGGASVCLSPRARKYADEHGVPTVALAGRGTGPEGRVVERDVVAYVQERGAQPVSAPQESAPKTPPRVTPLAARVADDLGVDIHDLALGLPGSRVRREDVLRHAEQTAPPAETPPVVKTPSSEGVSVQPLSGMRKRIAENVSRSAFTAPHVTLTLEVDMTEAAALRARLLPEIEKAYGARLSYNDILVKAVARALDEHPMANAALIGDAIHVYAHKNIGVAVALDNGLITPVVKEAERKTLGMIAAEMKALIERARSGKFTPDDISGGTFTISNLGAFSIDVFDPIINPPQSAILGVGRIADKPVVMDRQVVIRTMMNLCLSFDHRVLDGVPAARFLQRIKETLESPVSILI